MSLYEKQECNAKTQEKNQMNIFTKYPDLFRKRTVCVPHVIITYSLFFVNTSFEKPDCENDLKQILADYIFGSLFFLTFYYEIKSDMILFPCLFIDKIDLFPKVFLLLNIFVIPTLNNTYEKR